MWQIVLAVLFGALVVIVVAVLLGGKGGAGRQEAGAPVAALAQLPWRAQVEPSGGVQVMGLTVGGRAASRLEQAQALPRPRRATRPSYGSVQRRLGEKKHTAARKAGRKVDEREG